MRWQGTVIRAGGGAVNSACPCAACALRVSDACVRQLRVRERDSAAQRRAAVGCCNSLAKLEDLGWQQDSHAGALLLLQLVKLSAGIPQILIKLWPSTVFTIWLTTGDVT